MSETCWYCKKEFTREEGTKYLDVKIPLYKDFQQTMINVPRCPACAKKVNAWRWKTALVCAALGLAVGGCLLLTERNITGLTIYTLLMGGAVAGSMLGFIMGGPLRKGFEGGLANSFPDIKALLDSGWTVGTKPPVGMSGIQKTCSKCGRVVPFSAKAGDRCPYCGAYWSCEEKHT